MARLSPQNTQRAREVIALYPQPRSALIPLLHLAQEQDGWLQKDAMEHIAELLGITPAEVYGTATFYDMLFTHPVGRHLVSVCTNIACLLDGAMELLHHAESTLGVRTGATTPDGEFTLEEVECIGLCGNAPCLTVNWRFFGNVTHDGFDRLVEEIRAGKHAETVPPHGTLSRVRRSVGLAAAGPPRNGDAHPADDSAGVGAASSEPTMEGADQRDRHPQSPSDTPAAELRSKGDTAPEQGQGERQ